MNAQINNMIEIEMSKNIKEFEPKLMGPLTTRQLICVAIGVAIGVPIALLVPLSPMFKVIIGILCASPALLCGWLKIFDIPLEKFFIDDILGLLRNPQKRRYKTANTWEFLLEEDARQNQKPKSVKKSKDFVALK